MPGPQWWQHLFQHWLTQPQHLASGDVRLAPTAVAVGLGTAAAVTVGRSLLWTWRNRRLTAGARLIEVAVPPETEPGSAAAWWASLPGFLHPWWKRLLFSQPHIAWEYVSDAGHIRLQLWVPAAYPPGVLEEALRGAWPTATLTTGPASTPLPDGGTAAGGRLMPSRPDHFPLRANHGADPLRHLLVTLAGLRHEQRATVQILVRPVTGHRLNRAHRAAAALRGGRSSAPQARIFNAITPGHAAPSLEPGEIYRVFPERAEQVRAILAKAGQPRFAVEIRYAATTTHEGKIARGWAANAAHQLAATFAQFTSPHQHLRRRRLHSPLRHLGSRRLNRGFLLSVEELAALAHLPYDLDAPGVTRAGARPAAPVHEIPSGSGPDMPVRLLGDADSGDSRPVGLAVADARQHLHVMGETGVGKSTFLAGLVLSDAHAGRGAVVIDPKGDLIDDILDRLPERAIGRTVVFDPADEAPPPCVNILAGGDPSFVVDALVTIFRRCFSSAWGPRLEDTLRSACLTLVTARGVHATLADVPRLLSDHAYRAKITARVRDEDLRGFWNDYDAMPPGTRAAQTSPVTTKLRSVLRHPFIRDALSGAASTINIGQVLDSGGLVLARLPKGVLGEDATRLFGSLLVAHTWQAVTRRASRKPADRRDASAYIDEAHNFLNLPGSISDILAEARGYRFSLVIAHQHLSQFPRDLREAVAADARNKIYFNISPDDASGLARHVAPLLSAHDLANLGAHQAAARIVIGATPAPPFTFRTRPLPPAVPGRAEAVRTASRDQYAPPSEAAQPQPDQNDTRRPIEGAR